MLRACLLFIFIFTLTSCVNKNTIHIPEDNCAYNSFLKGNNAELAKDFKKAQEFYQEAYSCDPTSHYLQSKIPLMYIRMEDFNTAQKWLEENISHTKENKSLSLLLARLYSEEGLSDQAIDLYKKILLVERETEVLLNLGSLYHSLGLYKEAETIFAEVVATDKDSYPTNLLFARTLAADNQLERAEFYYQKALRLNWSIPLAYEMAAYFSETGAHQKSIQLYDEILAIQQDDELAFSLKMTELIAIKEISQAIAEVRDRRAYSQNPEQLDNVVVQTLFENDLAKDAIPLLKDMAERYSNKHATYTLALIYYDEKEYDMALYWLSQAPLSDELYEQRLQVEVDIYIKQKKLDKAIFALENDITSTGGTPAHYNLLASLYLRDGKRDSLADKTYQRGLQHFPAELSLSYAYALFLDKNNRYKESLAIMQAVLANDPNNAEALNFIGYTWANTNTNLMMALDYTIKASEIMPENGYIRDSVGWCYFKLGLYEKALESLIAANTLAPNDPNILQHLGDAYLAQGLIAKAQDSYQQALSLYQELGVQKQIDVMQRKINNLTSSSESLSSLKIF